MKRPPLEGVRVLDLTMMWAGPFATKLLAEMGAEVIKIESPRAWDNIRTLIPMPGVDEPWNASFYFNDYNRDKKSLILDLAHPRGREVFLQLVPRADVVIENYRADVLDNLGLGYEVLRAQREDIILVSMAGFGKTGSERNHVGFGPIIEQMGGVASLTGYGDDGEPYKTGISYGDPIGGIAAAGAVALALIQRKRTGKGSFVDLAQRETMASMIGEAFVASSLRGQEPVHRGNRSDRWAPQGIYPAAGDDQWIAVSVRDDAEWRALARLLGRDDLAELRLDGRRARHDEIDEAIAGWTRQYEAQAAMETLEASGIPAGRVHDSESVHDDPHLADRGFWVELPHPRMAPWRQPGVVWRFAEANLHLRRHAPLFGEHTAAILGELLGMTESELAALDAEGVTSTAPVNPGVG
jgi:crotonobetainyl-CoA:carnitine CoA-transferase CaiB-like acyl-CoA transferase